MPPPGQSHAPTVCWCGSTEMLPFSADYGRCARCGTLVLTRPVGEDLARVGPNEAGLYGEAYWYSHVEGDYGLPNILERARADLSERCLWWLRTLLKYRVPPARILELGSAHGGFVAILRAAGFDATGLELSPAICRLARQLFDVPMLQGPVEEQQLEPGSFDVIALMDVLEHLEDPVGTMRHCLELLSPGGFLLVQTPSAPTEGTGADLEAASSPFLTHLKPQEHLFLFTPASLEALFGSSGARVQFEPAIFAHYDMFAVIAREPMSALDGAVIDEALARTPSGRLIQALLDLDRRERDIQAGYLRTMTDLRARDEQLARALKWLEEARTDQAAVRAQLDVLGNALRESEADRAARLKNIRALEQLLRTGRADRASKDERIRVLEGQLAETTAERDQLRERLEAETAARARAEEERQRAEEAAAALVAAQAESAAHQANADSELRAAVEAIQQSPIYRALVRSGRWASLDATLRTALGRHAPHTAPSGTPPERGQDTVSLRRIAVDLTPVLPGADNGGAKVFALALVEQLGRLLPDCEIVLLTGGAAHEELARLEAPNVRRLLVSAGPVAPSPGTTRVGRPLWRRVARRVVPARFRSALSGFAAAAHAVRRFGAVRELGADLLFCPFTAPYYQEPGIPCVSVVYDLQYRTYPGFFSIDEREARERTFRETCRRADHVVCISEYVRQSVLAQQLISPERVSVIHLRPMPHAAAVPSPGRVDSELAKLGVVRDRFLFYPANLWPHKNHEVLLTALAQFRSRHPSSDLKLVCSGGGSQSRLEFLTSAASRMGLTDAVRFPGFVDDVAFASLLRGCRAVVFPSLYEGFGMPPLEAMAVGRPVACSDRTSLPEIVGEAALLFDPRKPGSVADAIERLEYDDDLRARLVEAGSSRVARFGNVEEMAREYVALFGRVLSQRRHYADAVSGLHEDGWSTDRVVVSWGESPLPRRVELTLEAPGWSPHGFITLDVAGGGIRAQRHRLAPGERRTIGVRVPPEPGFFEVAISPLSQPASAGVGPDERWLGCFCTGCRFVSTQAVVDVLARTA